MYCETFNLALWTIPQTPVGQVAPVGHNPRATGVVDEVGKAPLHRVNPEQLETRLYLEAKGLICNNHSYAGSPVALREDGMEHVPVPCGGFWVEGVGDGSVGCTIGMELALKVF